MVRYEIRGKHWLSTPDIIKFDSISSFFDLVAKKFMSQSDPITVARVVELYNADVSVASGDYLKLCDYTADEFDFYLMDSLMYKQDVDKYMTKNYEGFDWHYANLPNNTEAVPFVFDLRRGWGQPVSVVYMKELTQKDCVINKQGHQIWPVNTGKYPFKLVEMLNKKTEEINLVR